MNLNNTEKNFLTNFNTITKIIISLLFSIVVVFLKKELSLTVLFGASVIYLLPLKRFKLMIIMYIFLLLMFGISTFFTGAMEKMMSKMMTKQTEIQSTPVAEIKNQNGEEVKAKKPKRMGHPGRSKEKISMTVPFLRTALMLNLMFALTLSSGVRKMTNVLKTLKLPRIIFLPIIVVFRFVPSFLNDIKQIAENMKIKTAKPAFAVMFSNPKKYLRLLIIPSVIRSLRSSEELSAAAEMKGIDGSKNITNSAPEKWQINDALVIILSITFVVISFYLERVVL